MFVNTNLDTEPGPSIVYIQYTVNNVLRFLATAKQQMTFQIFFPSKFSVIILAFLRLCRDLITQRSRSNFINVNDGAHVPLDFCIADGGVIDFSHLYLSHAMIVKYTDAVLSRMATVPFSRLFLGNIEYPGCVSSYRTQRPKG
jgi:hypothetical protein